jgi:small subunit ribosomal protein S1
MTHETTPDPLTTPEAISEPVAEPAAEPEFTDPSVVNPPAEFAAEPELAEEASAQPEPETPSETAPVAEAPPEPPAPAAAEPSSQPEVPVESPSEPLENFGELLAAFEKTHSHRPVSGPRQLSGTVVSLTADQVFLDIGYKIEGVLPRTAFGAGADAVKVGDTVPVSITGRNEEGYYDLSRFRVAVPKDWTALEEAFAQKVAVAGTVTAVIKGGASVDVGVRAFMPASRSGTHDAAELEALVGQQITCRITKLDTAQEDVVVDRRVVLEEQAVAAAAGRYAALNEGDTLQGTVRSLVPYGAFVSLGGPEARGLDGLLHVGDISWTRIAKPEDVLSVGQQVEVKILHIDPDTKKISLGMKQLQAEPWETVPSRYQANQRVSGRVTRVTDFGAFVEIEPGIEGLLHVSEMSWGKKVRIASDIVKPGDHVDAVILGIKPEERRISLGLKQMLTDPWSEAVARYPVGCEVGGPVTKIMPFGAFVQIADGIEGMVHISEIVPDRRLNHPSEALREGQVVQAQVLAIDASKRQIKLSMKRLIPTSIDEYIAEHKPGDKVSGRVTSLGPILVELGQGIHAKSREVPTTSVASGAAATAQSADLSSLTSLLQARWKGRIAAPGAQPEPLAVGQVREFRIVKLDPKAKSIEVEPVVGG